MNRLKLACSVMLTACFGCAGTQYLGFGPFSSSSIAGGSLAGVAAFVPGLTPDDGEFSLIVFNTDSTATYDVTVTPSGSTAATRQASSCNGASFTAGCDVGTIAISATTTGLEAPATFTLKTDSTCKQQIVFIAVTGIPASGDVSASKTVTLTQTVPASYAACSLGL